MSHPYKLPIAVQTNENSTETAYMYQYKQSIKYMCCINVRMQSLQYRLALNLYSARSMQYLHLLFHDLAEQ